MRATKYFLSSDNTHQVTNLGQDLADDDSDGIEVTEAVSDDDSDGIGVEAVGAPSSSSDSEEEESDDDDDMPTIEEVAPPERTGPAGALRSGFLHRKQKAPPSKLELVRLKEEKRIARAGADMPRRASERAESAAAPVA